MFRSGYRLFLIIIPLLVSCSGYNKPKAAAKEFNPDSIIPQIKMECIMTDVHILEAGLLMERNEGKTTDKRIDQLYQGLFNKYGINRELYDYNIRYYSAEPDVFAKMYKEVNRQLAEKQKLFRAGK